MICLKNFCFKYEVNSNFKIPDKQPLYDYNFLDTSARTNLEDCVPEIFCDIIVALIELLEGRHFFRGPDPTKSDC